jgi:hypothetical protein
LAISYTGIILDEQSKNMLLARSGVGETPAMAGWEIVCHHMTICMGPAKDPDVQALLGQTVALEAIAYGVMYLEDDVGIAAVKVQTKVPCKNDTPHITLARHPSVPAKRSNEITNWTPLFAPVELKGAVEEVPFPKREKAAV